MSGPVRPKASLPTGGQVLEHVIGGVLDGHHIGDPPFYFNGQLGQLIAAPTQGDALFVSTEYGPSVPQSAIAVPPDINTAWQSLMWALGAGLPDGLETARQAARRIRTVR